MPQWENMSRVLWRWGCKPANTLNILAVFINIVLPTDGFSFDSECGNNTLFCGPPGVSVDDMELQFKNLTSPLAVNANQELHMWFGEDLFDCLETDNGGKTCADRYGLYM